MFPTRFFATTLCLLAGATHAYDNCDRLRQNDAAYRACMNSWHGSNKVDSSASDALGAMHQRSYEARAREEREREAALDRQRAEAARRQAEANSPEARARRERAERDRFNLWWNERLAERQHETNQLNDAAIVRRDAITRGAAMLERVKDKNRPTPDEYVRLISAVVPEWDLMRHWLSRAVAQHGGRFVLLDGLLQTMGCPDRSYAERTAQNKYCDLKYAVAGRQGLLDAVAQASPVDKLLVCGLFHAEYNFKTTRDAAAKDQIRSFLDACHERTPDVPADLRERFYANMPNIHRAWGWGAAENYPHFQYDRWFVFNHPGWEKLEDFADKATIDRIFDEAGSMASFRRHIDNPPSRITMTRATVIGSAAQQGLKIDWFDPPGGVSATTPSSPDELARQWRARYDESGRLDAAGKGEQALATARDALDFAEKSFGVEHANVGFSLHNLASLLADRGQSAEAEKLFRRALTIKEKQLGPGNVSTAISANNLAISLSRQKRYPESEAAHRRALALYEQALGMEHEDVAQSLRQLGMACVQQDAYDRAEPFYRRALAIYEKRLGAGHAKVGETLKELAGLYRLMKRESDAIAMEQRAARIGGGRG